MAELIRDLINQYPPLSIYILQYRITKEKLDQCFGSCQNLTEVMNKRLKIDQENNYLDFFDFLFTIFPYTIGSSSHILLRLINRDYYYEIHTEKDEINVISSTDYWKYEIFNRCIKEFRELLDTHNLLKDLNLFLRFQNLMIMILSILNCWNLKFIPSYRHLLKMDVEIMIELYELCLIVLKECQENNAYPLLNINGLFFTLFKKIYRRRVRLCIALRKKGPYEKKDMQYQKFV